MHTDISIAHNIAQNRKARKLTQEDLAGFLGVTKASVSKWETGQSYPDLELLPRIATYFGVSIDELVGYEPQMSRADIRVTCTRLRKEFAERPFAQAHEECRALVRDYFSCYPLLVQIATLYLNHLTLAGPEERDGLIAETADLCQRVRHGSTSSTHIRLAESIEALLLLMAGDARQAADLLGDAAEPDAGADILLARAYTALGQTDKADETLQSMIYQALVLNLNRLSEMALLHAADHAKLAAIHGRTRALIDTFGLEATYANIATIHLGFATAYIMGGDAEGAIGCLEDYERSCRALEFPLKVHGDEFFDKIDIWFEETSGIGTEPPRDESLIKQNLLASVTMNPAFIPLADDARFKRIVASLQEIAR